MKIFELENLPATLDLRKQDFLSEEKREKTKI